MSRKDLARESGVLSERIGGGGKKHIQSVSRLAESVGVGIHAQEVRELEQVPSICDRDLLDWSRVSERFQETSVQRITEHARPAAPGDPGASRAKSPPRSCGCRPARSP